MKKNGARLLILTALISPVATAKDYSGCSTKLPKVLIRQLTNEFPGWRLKDTSDLDPDDHQLWVRAHPKDCPGIAPGHFKGILNSYALLLVNESSPTRGYKLIVATSNPSVNGYSYGYTFDVLDHNETQSASGMVISKVKPGKYSDFKQTRTVTTQLDCINVERIGAATLLYYWTIREYRTLQTSD